MAYTLTAQELIEQREQMQYDMQCVLDGVDDTEGSPLLTNACQVIVDRMNLLIAKLEREPNDVS